MNLLFHNLRFIFSIMFGRRFYAKKRILWRSLRGQKETDKRKEGDRRRLATSGACSSRITAASVENCGEEGYSYCAQEALWWCQSWATGTRARTCTYTIWRHDCPFCTWEGEPCDVSEYKHFLSACKPKFNRDTC